MCSSRSSACVIPSSFAANHVLFNNIADVKADGPYQVTFTLSQPDPLFLVGPLGHFSSSIVPRKAVTEKGKNFEKGSDRHRSVPARERRERSFAGRQADGQSGVFRSGAADQGPCIFLYIADTTARTLGAVFRRCAYDRGRTRTRLGTVDPATRRRLSLVMSLRRAVSLRFRSIWKVKPFDDHRVRQAMAYLINRDEIAAALAPRRPSELTASTRRPISAALPRTPFPLKCGTTTVPTRRRSSCRCRPAERLHLQGRHLATRGLSVDHADHPAATTRRRHRDAAQHQGSYRVPCRSGQGHQHALPAFCRLSAGSDGRHY